MGKTTNERFAKKASSSFSEDESGFDTTELESESLVGGTSSRNSIVDDENH